MMVTIGSESTIQPLLSTLANKAAKADDKVDAYNEIFKLLTSRPDGEEEGPSFVEEAAGSCSEAVSLFITDMKSDSADLSQACLQTLGRFIHDPNICRALSEEESKRLIKAICDTIYQTTDKLACTRAMWCIASQDLDKRVLGEELHTMLNAIEHGQCKKNFQSSTVELEALNAIIHLQEQLPTQMLPHADQWGKLVYPLLLHQAAKVRERALMAMDIGRSSILHQHEQLAKFLLPDLKAMLASEMEKLMKSKQEVHVLKVWSFYVQILGKSLHGGGLINQILSVVELGFKNQNPNVKVAAYKAWECLIDNFALNPAIIGDGKRVKLIMQVFKINNTKLEVIAQAKLKAWWHFVTQLHQRSLATALYEQVCAPLLHYCFHGTANPGASSSGKQGLNKTPAGKLGGGTPFSSPATPGTPGSTPHPTFKSVQAVGAQILSMMIARALEDVPAQNPKYTIEKLKDPVVKATPVFVKHSIHIINMTKDCLSCCGNDLPEPLLYHIWQSLVSHIHEVIKQGKNTTDVFSAFLGCFRDLVQNQALQPNKLLKMYKSVLTLPSRIMSSSAYSIEGAMHGSPCQTLMGLLFHHRIVEEVSANEMFFVTLERLVEYGMSSSDPLGFCQSTVKNYDQIAESITNKESLWRMWSGLANPLLGHIMKTNEVNQGNNLEHDFGCMYGLLLFPVTKIPASQVPQTTEKSMMMTWTELYKTFARLSAMVANVEENICCEELCHEIVGFLLNNPEKLKDTRFVFSMTQMCQSIIEVVNFSEITPAPTFNFAPISPSPAKKNARKRGTLGCLHSFVVLVDKLLKGLKKSDQDSASSSENMSRLQLIAVNLISILDTLYNHVDKSAMLSDITSRLGTEMGYLFSAVSNKAASKLSSPQIGAKLEKLWMDMSTCIQGHMTGCYDTNFLERLSPLLEVTFTHQRRAIKTQTIMLWNVTFGTASALEYPNSLKPVLTKVKEKTHLSLPTWRSDATLVEDSVAASQTSLAGESQVPLPNMPGIPSPKKPLGSFLNKPVSPRVQRSPLRATRGSTPQATRRKLSAELQDMNTQDFVVIKPSPQKKRLLTDHQKEVMKEKRTIPALYSNVDASQDTSMMANFTSDTQMSETDTPTVEITPFPTFGKFGKKSPQKEKAIKDIQESTAIDQKTPETDSSIKPQRRSSSRKVRFTGDTDDENSQQGRAVTRGGGAATRGGKEDFATRLREVRTALHSSPDIDEITRSVEQDKAAREPDREEEDMDTGCTGEDDVVDSSVAMMSEEIPLTAPQPAGSSKKSSSRRKSSSQSTTQSSQLSECSKEVASYCTEKDGPAAAESSPGSTPENKPRSKTIRGRARLPENMKKDGTPKKSPIEDMQAIDTFLQKSAEKLKHVQGLYTRPVINQAEEDSGAGQKVSMTDAILIDNTEEDPDNKRRSPRKQVKVTLHDQTPPKKDPVIRRRKPGPACKTLYNNQLSPNEIPDSQAVADDVMDASMLDEVKLEESGMSTPTKNMISPSQAEPPRSPVVQLVRLSQKDFQQFSPKRNKFRLSRSSSFNLDDSTTEASERKPRVTRRGGLMGSSAQDLISIIDEDAAKVTVVEDTQMSEVPDADVSKKSDDLNGISPIVTDSVVEESVVSSQDSQATIVPVHKRRRSLPAWLKDMDTSGSEINDSQFADAESSQEVNTEDSSISKPRGRRGRKKKVDLENSEQWSQQAKDSEVPDNQGSIGFEMDAGNTIVDDDVTLSQSQSLLKSASKNEVTVVNKDDDVTSQSQGTSRKGKKRGRKTKVKTEDKVGDAEPEPEVKCDPHAQSDGEESGRISQARAERAVAGALESEENLKSAESTATASSENEPPVDVTKVTRSRAGAEGEEIVVSSQESSQKPKRRRRPPKVKPEDQKGEENPEGGDKEGGREEGRPGRSTRRRSSPRKADPGDVIIPDSLQPDIPMECTPAEDDDVPLSQLGTTKASEPEPAQEGDLSTESIQDIFNKNAGETSTPAKPVAKTSPGSDKGSTKRSGRKKKIRGKADKLKSQLDIDMVNMKSPLIKRLRSQKPHLRTRALNRSLDSLQTKTRSPRQKPALVEKSQDDLAIEDVKAELEQLAKEEKKGSPGKVEEETPGEGTGQSGASTTQPGEGTGQAGEDTAAQPEEETAKAEEGTGQPGEGTGQPGEDTVEEDLPGNQESQAESSPEERVSKVMDSLNAAKEGSPMKQSPPKKGKPFDMPDTPTSANRSSLSRASMILQRARMMFVKPSKSPPSLRARQAHRASDSKLFPRRPGILKSPSQAGSPAGPVGGSPISFRPIQPRIYSPSASPSAGILRKRRLSGDECTDSPSPPMKQRRVCFNDEVQTVEIPKTAEKARPSSPRSGRSPRPVNRCLALPQQKNPPSPLVTAGSSRVVTEQSKYITTRANDEKDGSTLETDKPSFVSGTVIDKRKETQSQTQNTLSEGSEGSTQESQLNLTEPVCPELVNCDSPIDQILPQLTTSVWIRGLRQLVRSKNIKTVGNLSAMTEKQVDSLPIKSPKVATVKKALQNFAGTRKDAVQPEDNGAEEFKVPVSPVDKAPPSTDTVVTMDTMVTMETEEVSSTSDTSLPPADGSTSDTSLPPADAEIDSPAQHDCSMDSDTNELLGDIHRLEDKTEEKDTSSTDTTNVASATTGSSGSVVHELKGISQRLTAESLRALPSDDLLALYGDLSDAMSKVMLAMREKSRSPPASHAS